VTVHGPPDDPIAVPRGEELVVAEHLGVVGGVDAGLRGGGGSERAETKNERGQQAQDRSSP
jgi:hypothetical protein